MPLKNYTTEVPAMKSIGQIENNLVKHGAISIVVNYGPDREPENLCFVISTPQGTIPFRLPANIKAVASLLQGQRVHGYTKPELASRVAWRIIKDWVDAQLAIIETEMVTIEQVFLPYMLVKGQNTLYETMKDYGFYLTEGQG